MNPSDLDDLHALLGMRHVNVKTRAADARITRRANTPRALISHDGRGFHFSHARVVEIEDALRRGDAVDDSMRLELRALCAHVAYAFEEQPARGRPIDRRLFDRAAVVLALHVLHDVPLKAAISVMASPTGTADEQRKDRQRLERAYSKVKAIGDSGDTIRARESDVQAALDRLNPERTRK